MSRVIVRNNPDRVSVQVGAQTIVLDEQEFADLTAQVLTVQHDRLQDPDTDGIEEATSGVAFAVRAAFASVMYNFGDESAAEVFLEAAADIPEEQAKHLRTAGWSVA